MSGQAPGASAASAIARMDHWRCNPSASLQRLGFKEWQHFYIFGSEVDLLVNFSVMNGVQLEPDPRAMVPRMAILARTPSGWHGSVVRFDPDEVRLTAGRIDAELGPNEVRFRNGAYELRIDDPRAQIAARITLQPVTAPSLTEPIRLGSAGSMRWLVVSRLSASGTIEVGQQRFALRDAPSYHDHDWGSFQWGEGFAWNWSVALAAGDGPPWTITATQVTDQGRRQLYTDGLMLWLGRRLLRSFRREGITTAACGRFRPQSRPLRIPNATWLAAPGEAFDIPQTYVVRAAAQGDVVELNLEVIDYAQIALPGSLADDTVCILSEIRADFAATARVRGTSATLRGPAVLELLHVVR